MQTVDPLLTQDEVAIVESLDSLCAKILVSDYLTDIDHEARYPTEAMEALGASGWAELCVPIADGGQGANAEVLCVVLETIAHHSLVVAQAVYSMWIMGGDALARLGTPQQRARYLPAIVEGHGRIAIALTEPGSGSDAAALRTTAVRAGGSLVVNGQKVFITGASIADVIVTAVRTASRDRRQDGISILLIEPGSPGVTIRRIPKMGLKAIDLCEVYFDDVRVPAEQVLGEVDAGWSGLLPGLAKERAFLAAISVGAMRNVLDLCLEHAQVREAFGRPIASHQMIGEKLVRMRVGVDSGRALVKQAARLIDREHPDAQTASSVAKLNATTAYVDACRDGVQVFGGYGFTDDYAISRHYRDCKYLEIGGGTSEVQKILIARSLGVRM